MSAKDDEFVDISDLLEDGEVPGEDDDNIDTDLGEEGDVAGDDAAKEEAAKDNADLENDEVQIAGDEEPEPGELPAISGNAASAEPPVAAAPAAPAPAAFANPFSIPADAKEQIAGFDAALEKLNNDWNAGDISDAEYQGQMREIADKRTELTSTIMAAQKFDEAQRAAERQREDAQWETSVKNFKATNPDLWSDAHKMRFNSHVQSVTADPKYESLSFDQQLMLAANLYAAERTALGQDAPLVKSAAKSGKKAAEKPVVEKRPEVPVTLSRVPAADANSTDGSAFEHLNKMIDAGMVDEVEDEIMKMSPAMRDRWLREN